MAEAAKRDPVGKAFELVAWMVDHGGRSWGVRELAAELDAAPSTIHRLLQVLEGMSIVDHDDAGYQIGLELYRMSGQIAAQSSIPVRARPFVEDLVRHCNETAYLGLYDPVRRAMVFALAVESTHPLRYVVELNRWHAVHAGASGLAIMAFLSDEEREAVIADSRLAAVTTNTITSRKKLESTLEKIRGNGYALTHGQRIVGAVGLAAPIYAAGGAVVGDVCISVPEQRFEPRDEPALAAAVRECAQKVSAALGWAVASDVAVSR